MQKLVDVSSCGKTTTNLGSCEHSGIGQNINIAISDLENSAETVSVHLDFGLNINTA